MSEALKAKHTQLQDKNVKMKESVKVARCKVAESQAQLNHFQIIADQKKARLIKIGEMKEELELWQEMDSAKVAGNLQSTFESIKNARFRFQDDNVKEELQNENEEIEMYEKEIAAKTDILHQELAQLAELKAKSG